MGNKLAAVVVRSSGISERQLHGRGDGRASALRGVLNAINDFGKLYDTINYQSNDRRSCPDVAVHRTHVVTQNLSAPDVSTPRSVPPHYRSSYAHLDPVA